MRDGRSLDNFKVKAMGLLDKLEEGFERRRVILRLNTLISVLLLFVLFCLYRGERRKAQDPVLDV